MPTLNSRIRKVRDLARKMTTHDGGLGPSRVSLDINDMNRLLRTMEKYWRASDAERIKQIEHAQANTDNLAYNLGYQKGQNNGKADTK